MADLRKEELFPADAFGLFYLQVTRIPGGWHRHAEYNQDAELRKQEIENRSLTENVTEYINQHYADSLTIDQLAEQFFVSKYHLMHEFSQKTGTSIYRYLMQQRRRTWASGCR